MNVKFYQLADISQEDNEESSHLKHGWAKMQVSGKALSRSARKFRNFLLKFIPSLFVSGSAA